jgi:predicted RNase H-like HicB family nuclease
MKADLRIQAEKLSELPYTVEVALDETTDGEPVYLARVPELEGCIAQGRTMDDALESLREAKADYITSLLEDGVNVPLPSALASITATGSSATFLLSNQPHESGLDPLSKEYRLFEASLIAT